MKTNVTGSIYYKNVIARTKIIITINFSTLSMNSYVANEHLLVMSLVNSLVAIVLYC